MVILENIDIDKAILQNIDIDKISNRFKFGISNRATSARRSTEAIRRPLESFKILELNKLGNRHGDHRDPDKRRRRVTFCDDVIEHEPCCYSDESQEDGELEDDHEEKQGRAVNEEEENCALND